MLMTMAVLWLLSPVMDSCTECLFCPSVVQKGAVHKRDRCKRFHGVVYIFVVDAVAGEEGEILLSFIGIFEALLRELQFMAS